MRRSVILFLPALVLAPTAHGQGNEEGWRFLPSSGFGVCFEVPRIEQQNLPNTSVRCSSGLLLNAGIRVRPPGRFALDLRGELALQAYHMRPGGERYVLYHNVPRVELQPTYFPNWLERQEVQLAIGIAAGISYPGTTGPSNSDDAFTVETSIASEDRPYLALEVAAGMQGEGQLALEVALRYLAHMDQGPAWTSTVTSDTGQATFSASDNYFGMVLRFQFVRKKQDTRMACDLTRGIRSNENRTFQYR